MLTRLLSDNIHFSNQKLSWQDAISLAAKPLLEKNYITQNYINDMIENVNKNGSYIVLVPEIALPHARSNENVLQTSMSFLKLQYPVIFPDRQTVSVMFVIATTDNNGHLDALSNFADVLVDSNKQKLLKTSTTKEEIITVLA